MSETFPHMCADDHPRIGHSDSESEMCPLCVAQAELERLRAELSAIKEAHHAIINESCNEA